MRVGIVMIDIPLNKALVAVEDNKPDCRNCDAMGLCGNLACVINDRKDGKNVIFKLVDVRPDGYTRTIDLMQYSRKELGEEP